MITVIEKNSSLFVSYEPEEKLQESFTLNKLSPIVQGYRFYSEIPLSIEVEGNLKVIKLPKLTYNESSDS